jgi:hypothetical protein
MAGALVLASNALVLTHVARNRSGPPDARIVLTDRELRYWKQSDDSGVHLTLQTAPDLGMGNTFLNSEKLRELGFDTSFPPSGKDAWTRYANMAGRPAFIAFELDGRAFAEYKDRRREQALQRKQKPEDVERDLAQAPRLVPMDASKTREDLRLRHPDRTRVLILPAVVRIQVDSSTKEPRLRGWLTEWPSLIHVPKPYSDTLRNVNMASNTTMPRFEVELAYGNKLEPWVVGVRVLRLP